jgi:sensor histidine kinase YesM
VLLASFVNYTVSVESDPDVTWARYFRIHLFYWLAWAVIGEWTYKISPHRLELTAGKLRSFVGIHALMLCAVVAYYSVYYWAINSEHFRGAGNAAEALQLMYFRAGPVAFHVMNVVTYLFVLLVCQMIRQSRLAHEQEEKRAQLELAAQTLQAGLLESKLMALNSQMHPHFLFNAMNNIASMIATDSKNEAYEAVTLLAGLLRKTFQYARLPRITLENEMELVNSMLIIGKMRFEDRLTWSVKFAEELHKLPVPPFVVQPLVENALRHGVENSAKPVHIEVDIERMNGVLAIRVSDNGAGIRNTQGDGDGGFGLGNLRERLRLMNESENAFRISVPTGGGFRVDIELPVGESHE